MMMLPYFIDGDVSLSVISQFRRPHEEKQLLSFSVLYSLIDRDANKFT